MLVDEEFRKLADGYQQRRNRHSEQRKLLSAKWAKAKEVLASVCDRIVQPANSEYGDRYTASFSCVNGSCVLGLGLKQGQHSHELKFSLDREHERIVVTDDLGGVEHAFDLEPLDNPTIDGLEERVVQFLRAFFEKLSLAE